MFRENRMTPGCQCLTRWECSSRQLPASTRENERVIDRSFAILRFGAEVPYHISRDALFTRGLVVWDPHFVRVYNIWLANLVMESEWTNLLMILKEKHCRGQEN